MKIKELAPLTGGGRWDPRAKLDIRTVYTDIDETISHRDSLHVVSPYTSATFAMLRSTGIYAGIATARALQKAQPVIQEVNPYGLSILSSGAQILDTRTWQIREQWSMPTKHLTKLILELQNEHIPHVVQDSGIDFHWRQGLMPGSQSRLGNYVRPVDDQRPLSEKNHRPAMDYWPQQAFVLAAKDVHPDNLTHVLDMANAYSSAGIVSSIGTETGTAEDDSLRYEVFFADQKANKAFAAQWIAEELNVPLEQTLAIGNGRNDVGLLMACGHAGVVGNAVEAAWEASTIAGPGYAQDGAATIMRVMTGLDLGV